MSTKQKRVAEPAEFDVSKYIISSELETRILIIPTTGDEVEIKIRNIPWSKRNKIISDCLKWSDGGQVDFDGDKYLSTCLEAMVIEAPWGVTDSKFLASIDHRLGNVLEAIVPKAFDESETNAVNNAKKG